MQAGVNIKTDSPEITVLENLDREDDIETDSPEITVLDNLPEDDIEKDSLEITVLDNQPATAASQGLVHKV